MEEAEVDRVQLIESAEYPTVLFELADETFHKVTLSVQMSIVITRSFTNRSRRDDRNRSILSNDTEELIGIVTSVSDDILA